MFFVLVAAIILSVILAALIIIPEFEKMQCAEKGGNWSTYFDVGCKMEPEECRQVGGVPEECRPSIGLSCTDVCHFR